jgi:hypothetical protein
MRRHLQLLADRPQGVICFSHKWICLVTSGAEAAHGRKFNSIDEQRLSDQELREVDKVFIVTCGTA